MADSSLHPANRAAPKGGPWFGAFGQAQPRIINVFGNEDSVVLEVQFQFQQRSALVLAQDTMRGGNFTLNAAFVCHCHDGAAAQVDAYYDLGTALRGVNVLPAMPLGHDERDATSPVVLHASGFVARSPEVVQSRNVAWPVTVANPPRFSLGKSRIAQSNAANCTGIHEAFVTHDPAKFGNLIAENAVWIDVPTGEVLNGAVAAAHHDHGNWMTAFPDSKAEVTNMVPNDNWVAVQHRGFGTHSGPLVLGGQTFPPTGRPVDIRVLDIVEYADGRAVLIRNYYDMGLMIVKLGVADAVAMMH